MPLAARTPRTGLFHRESTRLRSNVADQVQRDLLPAGRMLSVFLVLCELFAEVVVLVWSKGDRCDRPLRFWVCVLIMLQTGTVVLNLLNIWYGRDSLGQHRNGLSASDLDMYTDVSNMPPLLSSADPLPDPSPPAASRTHDRHRPPIVVVDVVHAPGTPGDHSSPDSARAHAAGDSPAFASTADASVHASSDFPSTRIAHASPSQGASTSSASAASSSSRISITISGSSGSAGYSTELFDRYVRIVNAWYLVWFILGSFWVSDGGTCSTTAPHLYRLIVALTIIYYALLFLPLACFCLIVCCLPLFILVYRIMLPYAERDRRRPRAADPAQVQNLNSISYSPATFANIAGNDSLEDASCVICLCEYEEGETVRFLPCKHHFHQECVDVWLRLDKACCLCKQDIDAQTQPLTPPV